VEVVDTFHAFKGEEIGGLAYSPKRLMLLKQQQDQDLAVERGLSKQKRMVDCGTVLASPLP
jgi:hypothetical protein